MFVCGLSGGGSNPVTEAAEISEITPVSRIEFVDIQVITECRFTLNAFVT